MNFCRGFCRRIRLKNNRSSKDSNQVLSVVGDFGDTEKREDDSYMTIGSHEEGLRGTVITQQCEVHDSNSGKWTVFFSQYTVFQDISHSASRPITH